jgi:hypothetical protein
VSIENSICQSCESPGLDRRKQVNETLNLNLGLPINPENKLLRQILRWVNIVGVMWWEDWLFAFIKALPVYLRRSVCMAAWQVYFLVHKRIVRADDRPSIRQRPNSIML